LEITDVSSPIQKVDFSTEGPMAIIVGAENRGISDPVLKTADSVLHIEMFGNNSSMNVVQATNIALYEITRQLM
jgi:tRNA G18 (ribose-2'-O)-methylase SpoU